MLTLFLLSLLVLVSLLVRAAARPEQEVAYAESEDRPSPAARAWHAMTERRRPVLPSLPEGHRPPAGLGPLSPSERFLRTESTRGIRALQLWLLDQDGASA